MRADGEDEERVEDGTEVNDQFQEIWFREQAQASSPIVILGTPSGLWVYVYMHKELGSKYFSMEK